MQQRRREKFLEVARRRQPDLTVILENVTDMHNIGAVLRSCDSTGIAEIYVLHTEAHLQTDFVVVGKRTSMGTRKWVDVRYYTDLNACFNKVRAQYGQILAAQPGGSSRQLYQLDLTHPVALLFGNEHSGLSAEALREADGNFYIPHMGMAESLNISVACAVTLYEAYRQRAQKGYYEMPYRQSLPEQEARIDTYLERHEHRGGGKLIVHREG
jgi:tRNA (guanosine-2'-O-)-methyltransferase